MKTNQLNTRKALEPRQTLQSSVHDSISRVILFHEAARDFWQRWKPKVKDEKSKVYLEHLAQLEARRAGSLQEYASQAPHEVLTTWLKVGPDIEVHDWLSAIEMDERVTTRDVSEIAGKLYDLLLKVLGAQSNQTESEDVGEFLKHIRDDEQRAKLYAIRSTELD